MIAPREVDHHHRDLPGARVATDQVEGLERLVRPAEGDHHHGTPDVDHRRVAVEAAGSGSGGAALAADRLAQRCERAAPRAGRWPRRPPPPARPRLARDEAAGGGAAGGAARLEHGDVGVEEPREPARGVAGAHGAGGVRAAPEALEPGRRLARAGPGAVQLDRAARLRARDRPQPGRQRAGQGGQRDVVVRLDQLDHGLQRVAQPVQEADLEQRDRRGRAAQLVFELGVQGAEEARVEQDARARAPAAPPDRRAARGPRPRSAGLSRSALDERVDVELLVLADEALALALEQAQEGADAGWDRTGCPSTW